MPDHNDSWEIAATNRSYYRALLDAGVEIYGYDGGLLRAKTLTVYSVPGLCMTGSNAFSGDSRMVNLAFLTSTVRRRRICFSLSVAAAFLFCQESLARQFAGDNQWVAPYGASTLVATVGKEYAQAYDIAALLPEREFNLQLTHYCDDPEDGDGSCTATNLYAKHRLSRIDDELAGYSIMESPGFVAAPTDSGAFNGSGGAGVEFGVLYFTDPHFCFGGCR